jgi:LysM repeat protein
MITAFVVICVGMVLGMLLVRLLDEASRTIAAIPTDAAAARAEATATAVRANAPQPGALAAPAGTPAISTDIRVIQPNYTVAPGDTLGSIARRHGTSVDALASINNLENRNSLSIGQKLIIP